MELNKKWSDWDFPEVLTILGKSWRRIELGRKQEGGKGDILNWIFKNEPHKDCWSCFKHRNEYRQRHTVRNVLLYIVRFIIWFVNIKWALDFWNEPHWVVMYYSIISLFLIHYQIWFDLLLFCRGPFVSVFMRDISVYFSRIVFIWIWY